MTHPNDGGEPGAEEPAGGVERSDAPDSAPPEPTVPDTGSPHDLPFFGLDLEALTRTLASGLQPAAGEADPLGKPPETSRPSPAALEELAEDMLDLLQGLSRVEELQQGIVLRLQQLDERVEGLSRTLGRELHALRRDLLGEAQGAASMRVFVPVVTTLDRLRRMHEALGPDRDGPALAQIGAIVDLLALTLRSLGFEEYRVEPGAPFDPARMECLDQLEGAPGRVLAQVRPGYTAGSIVARPAGVTVGRAESEPGPGVQVPAAERGDA